MNYTVYCRLAWSKKCIISVKCVTSTTLGDPQRMLGLLRGAPGVVSYFRRKTAVCVSRNGPKSDRCHLGDESPNLSGIGLRCVSCNRPLVTPLYGYFCVICFPWSLLLAFLSTFLPLPFSDLSSHLPLFLQPSCFFVSDLFGNLSSFNLFCSCVQPI